MFIQPKHLAVSIATTLAMVPTAAFAASNQSAGYNTDMQIMPNGSIASQTAPSEYFSGVAPRLDMRVSERDDPSRLGMALVSFEPSSRSNWHTHPAGQMLIVTSGQGYVQSEGGDIITINPGDMVWTPAGVKHWHGATESNGMSHYAIQESVDGTNVNWMEPVTDSQYAGYK